jgi:hypothetical protein
MEELTVFENIISFLNSIIINDIIKIILNPNSKIFVKIFMI